MGLFRLSRRLTARLAIGVVAAGLAAIPTTTTHAATVSGGVVNGLETYNTPFFLGCATSATVFLEDVVAASKISLNLAGSFCLNGETATATVSAATTFGGCMIAANTSATWTRTGETTVVTFSGTSVAGSCQVTFVLIWTDGASSIIPGPSFNSAVLWGIWAEVSVP